MQPSNNNDKNIYRPPVGNGQMRQNYQGAPSTPDGLNRQVPGNDRPIQPQPQHQQRASNWRRFTGGFNNIRVGFQSKRTATGARADVNDRIKGDDTDDLRRKKDKRLSTSLKQAREDYRNRKSKANASGSIASKIAALFAFIGHLIVIFFKSIWKAMLGIAVIAVTCFAVGAIGVGFLVATTLDEIPALEDYSLMTAPQNSTIYDVDGNVIGVISVSDRKPVSSGEIAQSAKDATVSIEDERFYDHEGVDLMGILRAVYYNYQSWRTGDDSTQGASTITQQYIRNAYDNVGFEQTINRKLTEIVLAVQLEATMSKDDILTSYLNTVYYGNGCYGIEAASQYYFGHPASELSYYESAMLAAILQSPTMYDPATEEGLAANQERALIVLDKMYSLGKLGDMSSDDLIELKKTDPATLVHITEKDREINQPYYYDYVMSELRRSYTDEEIESGGWQIHTTLSIADGEAAANVIRGLEDLYGHNGITGAIADVDVQTGAVNAFCGATDYETTQFDIATSAQLQTGSSLKPFLYAAACEYDGYYTTDRFSAQPVDVGTPDAPHVITPYIRGGSGTIKEGIVQSDNAMAIRMAQEIGLDDLRQMMSACNIDSELDDNVIAVIGGQETGFTPIELATGFASIANDGMSNDTWCISSITDTLGNVVYEHEQSETYAMSPEVSHQITDAMVAAVDEAGWYHIPFDDAGWTIAAKTGTTDDDQDSWCCGFDTTRAVVIWTGGRDQKMHIPNSSYNTTTAFSDYFYAVGQDDPKEEFEKPQYKTTVPTPNDGETIDQYASRCHDMRLNVEIEYVNSSTVDDGGIVDIPQEGQLIDRDSDFTAQVSSDAIRVPDFVGMTPSQAYNSGAGLSLSYDVTYATSGSTTPTITSQSVEPGTSVQNGASVVLTVTILTPAGNSTSTQVPQLGSDDALGKLQTERDQLQAQVEQLQAQQGNGNGEITVPNVTGLSASDARQVLTSLGLNVSYAGSSDATIIGTTPVRGTAVESGDTITLRTSSSSGASDNGNNSGSSNSTSRSNSSSTSRR